MNSNELINSEYIDKEIHKARTRLIYFSSPEEYWMNQGKIQALKELKEKLNEN